MLTPWLPTGLLTTLLLGCTGSNPPTPPKPAKHALLVFYKTAGFRHESIPAGLRAIQQLGAEHGFAVDTTNAAARFTPEQLQPYGAVVFLNTTQDVLNPVQQTAFEQYIRAGKGFVGVHAATDTEYDWPWYNGLVGAYFSSHPAVQTATVRVVDKQHPATDFLPATWSRTDEWYNFKSIRPGLTILATLDETTYSGGTNGPTHPIAWYHSYDGGRAFYTAGGHTAESYTEPLFVRHLLGGIRYALGQP
ncbi:type 1 glutamine amidotransferase [Hymenobacter luteus]|uniref:Type 1 glutamine amidotransferase n=2 Tax=Hymenobacter TaxID=89966 RepID=A0A7W9T3P9_9BACT|nr:ThuA domain-containing protein [Hymenobacter latericoloratus]MBB4603101.1 type 1 glutamine amidotransferase [Hymenobacter latericoloratus]MBB6060940.1 type 1 glutamine amidotransferase [Hymenobacter luteus]